MSLAGYEYQIDVSVWLALDLILAGRLTHELVLEPASQEDIEADLEECAPGRVTSVISMSTYRLVVQAKLRTGDAWTVFAACRERRVLLVPMLKLASGRDDAIAESIKPLLPIEHLAVGWATGQSDIELNDELLADLGDPDVVAKVIRLSNWLWRKERVSR